MNNSFAEPKAEGCAGLFAFLIDPIVNAKLGLTVAEKVLEDIHLTGLETPRVWSLERVFDVFPLLAKVKGRKARGSAVVSSRSWRSRVRWWRTRGYSCWMSRARGWRRAWWRRSSSSSGRCGTRD